MKCGLLGRTLGHSYSPQIHQSLASYSYSLFEREPEELEQFLRNGDFAGINVTIPYKKAVIPYLNDLSPIARKLGAVNTIVRREDGSLWGHNTDYYGFSSMVSHCGVDVREKKALVLGSGGASNTAAAVLQEQGARVVVISRSGENHYGNLELHKDTAIIVNATPVGMYPNTDRSPVDIAGFPHLEAVLDLIYNPARTRLLQEAQEKGLKTENGLWMLVAQAKEAAEHFTGTAVSEESIAAIHQRLAAQMENVILIGMPGCGKSTIGHLLAEKTGRRFADADEAIVAMAGKTIPEIFAQDGEEVFRQWETAALKELGKQSALVISTGGGCVTRQRNYPLLRQNGRIFWLRRDPGILPTEGRPISQSTDLSALYTTRKPMYESFADHAVDNNADPDKTVDAILSLLEETV